MPEVSAKFSGWGDVQVSVDQLVADSSEPFANTVANARDLLALCVKSAPVPTSVAKGYWSTVSFSWKNFEIEFFEDRLEVYRFMTNGAKSGMRNTSPARRLRPGY
jgi:hypothetical protein